MRLTRRTAQLEIGGQEYTASELTCAEAEEVEDLVVGSGSKERPLTVTAKSLVVALRAKHPDITPEHLLKTCTARELLGAMKTINELCRLEGDAKGEAESP